MEKSDTDRELQIALAALDGGLDHLMAAAAAAMKNVQILFDSTHTPDEPAALLWRLAEASFSEAAEIRSGLGRKHDPISARGHAAGVVRYYLDVLAYCHDVEKLHLSYYEKKHGGGDDRG